MKMAKSVLTLQRDSDKQGQVSLEVPNLKLGLSLIGTCCVDHLSFDTIKGQGEAYLTYQMSLAQQSHLQKPTGENNVALHSLTDVKISTE